jgi:hypothetical protein
MSISKTETKEPDMRYEIIENDNDLSVPTRTVVASNLGGDNAIATRDRFRNNVPAGSSVSYSIREMRNAK